jgi:hypothetical protein
MKTPRRCVRYALTVLAAPTLFFVLGCGDDGLGKRYPVHGTVSYKGAPVAKGTISFVPEDKEGRGATGKIDNGSYSLTTQTPDDGAFPGKYTVTVDTREVGQAAQQAATEKFAKENKIEGLKEVPQEVQAKRIAKAEGTTPIKYMAPQSSDLKATVEAQSNKFDFELKD